MKPGQHLFVFLFILCLTLGTGTVQAETRLLQSQEPVDTFLSRHWNHPLALQGKAPATFSPIEQNLSPASCGTCHLTQYQDWQGSMHAHAMGPGIMGQLVDMNENGLSACLKCHAPLQEQGDSLRRYLQGIEDHQSDSKQTGSNLHEHGMICAACHVRNYQWFGPPRIDGTVAKVENTIPHKAWTSSEAFEDSRFCSTCHQFNENGYALNGKLLENTYEEWKNSRYADQGISCQKCHMPNRRHLWRGIHDPTMTRDGVSIEAALSENTAARVGAKITIRNSNTGHYFPTYITPKVLVETWQSDSLGEGIENTTMEYTIGRDLPLNLAVENFDTRLAPGEAVEIRYDMPRSANAITLKLQIRVLPDEFYTRFYSSLLQNGFTSKGTSMIAQALQQSRQSAYTLFEKQFNLD